jgi:hypothetical protein
MIGDRDLTIAIPSNCDQSLIRLLLKSAHQTGHRHLFRLSRNAMIDDHLPFHQAGIPVVNMIDFEYGSSSGANNYWHTIEDTTDKLSPESLRVVGEVTIQLINNLFEANAQ